MVGQPAALPWGAPTPRRLANPIPNPTPTPTPNPNTNATQYECIAGEKRGECSAKNWFEESAEGKDKVCGASCVHVSLLRPAPYYALWYPGPLAKDFKVDEHQPRYEHDPARLTLGLALTLTLTPTLTPTLALYSQP